MALVFIPKGFCKFAYDAGGRVNAIRFWSASDNTQLFS